MLQGDADTNPPETETGHLKLGQRVSSNFLFAIGDHFRCKQCTVMVVGVIHTGEKSFLSRNVFCSVNIRILDSFDRHVHLLTSTGHQQANISSMHRVKNI